MAPETNSKVTDANREAWNASRYNAWIAAFGDVESAAQRILSDPTPPLRRILPYLGSTQGSRICSVQGSHGRVAVALAALGATVQVIDFSDENKRFALELATAADVSIEYAVCDILEADSLDLPHKFDTLVLELGILHYHEK